MSLQQVNLLSPQLLTPRVAFSSKTIAWMVLAVVVTGLLLYAWVELEAGGIRAQHEQAQATREALQVKIDALSQTAADGLSVEDQRAQAMLTEKQRIARLRRSLTALGAQEGAPRFSARLRALANERMTGLWLTEIAFAGDGFRLVGRALQAELVPEYLRLLSRQPALQTLPLASFRIEPAETADGDQGSSTGKPVLPGFAFIINPAPKAR